MSTKKPAMIYWKAYFVAVAAVILSFVAAAAQTRSGATPYVVTKPGLGNESTEAGPASAELNIPDAAPSKDQSGRRPPPQGAPSQAPADQTPLAAFPPLYLENVLKQVEANYPKLRGADVERRVAGAKLLEKQGAFDPVLSVSSDYLRFNSTTTRGRALTARQNEVGLEIPTRSGIKYLSGVRLNTGTVKSPLSSTGDSGEYFGGIAIPLLRDRGINEKFAAEQQAQLGLPLANADFAETRLDILINAATIYWDWVGAKRRIDVNNRLYDLSRLRAEQVGERVRAGDLPPIDETEAKQEVQRRRSGVIKSTADFQKAAFKLSNYLWDGNGEPSPLPAANFVPGILPPPELYTEAQADEARRLALARRPELQRIDINQDINDVDLQLARNQRRPGLDLYLSPGVDSGDSSIGPTMKFGVTLTLPFRRRTAEGQITAAQLKRQKLDLEAQAERLRIANQVNDALTSIHSAYGRHLAAQEELTLARDVERGEGTRFEAGDSTLFLVNQRERATAEAEIKAIDVETEYHQALALLRGVSGQFPSN